eukprot:COSAG01_NODE_49073_length_375_cov_1.050725_1_plen_101_part_10
MSGSFRFRYGAGAYDGRRYLYFLPSSGLAGSLPLVRLDSWQEDFRDPAAWDVVPMDDAARSGSTRPDGKLSLSLFGAAVSDGRHLYLVPNDYRVAYNEDSA